MTHYIAAYDTEMYAKYQSNVPTCLEACKRIVEVHHKHQMPATFFLVGRALESAPEEYRKLLDDPLFEIASHTWSHQLLMKHALCGDAIKEQEALEEIVRAKTLIEQVFGRRCVGFRTPCGFPQGLKGETNTLRLIAEAGYTYVSSQLWGPDFTLPAPPAEAYSYAADGFPDLIEFPGHGWHENLLKGNNSIFGMHETKILMFPQPFPEAVPTGFVKTPAEEFRYNNQVFIDLALARKLSYASLIWHPWSLGMFDPRMEMLEMTFDYVRGKGLVPTTFERLRNSRGA